MIKKSLAYNYLNPFIIFICLSSSPIVLSAQKTEQPKFSHLTTDDGLSQNSIEAILKDNRGFLWFGTQDGLNKYDGYNFTVFRNDPEDSTTIKDNEVTALFEDHKGDLWIGTMDGGLNLFDRSLDQFIRFDLLVSPDSANLQMDVTTIVEDGNGYLWVGTIENGIYIISPDRSTYKHLFNDDLNTENLPSNLIYDIYSDKNGIVWVATSVGLCQLVSTEEERQSSIYRFTNFSSPKFIDALGRFIVSEIFEDSKNTFWIGTVFDGLFQFDRTSKIFNKIDQVFSLTGSGYSDEITVIGEDDKLNLWIGTSTAGLFQYDRINKVFSHYKYSANQVDGINNNTIHSLYSDNEGILWLGTFGGGVNKLTNAIKRFEHYSAQPYKNSLNSNLVFALFEDSKNNLWIGTENGGVNKFDREKSIFTHYKNNPKDISSLSNNSINAISEDLSGNIWIGTYGGGVNILDTDSKTFTHYYFDPDYSTSLSDDYIFSIIRDKKGNMWVGTELGGLNKFNKDKNSFEHYFKGENDTLDFEGEQIIAIYEDNSGLLWIGTGGSGLIRLNPNTKEYKRYSHDPKNRLSIGSNYIMTICEDKSGFIWIGTAKRGVDRLDLETEEFKHFREKDGLPNNAVYGILSDNSGRLWISTNNGLCSFNPEDFTFKYFTTSEGLQSTEFNQNAYFKNENGEMYFGGINGFNIFHPDSIQTSNFIPPVHITEFNIFNRPVEIGNESPLHKTITETSEIVLSYSDNVFSFEFAALSYLHPEINKYAYKLEGFDKEYRYTDSKNRLAVYTNIEPGEYILKVIGSNSDEVWNTTGTQLLITITPPIWQTWWARLIFITIALCVGIIILRSRLNKLKNERRAQQEFSRKLIENQEMERKRIASSLHDSLGQNLLVIKNRAVLGQRASGDKDKVDEQLKEISSTVSLALQDVKLITQNLRPYQLDKLGLTDTIKSTIRNINDSSSTEFSLQIDDINGCFTKADEINFFRVIQESINNILKHSEASRADISIKKIDSEIIVRIKDNGKGVKKDLLSSGNFNSGGMGLRGINERTRILGGKLEMPKNIDSGFELVLTIPQKNSL